ncbi:MAG: ABC transporter permease subunit [Candidatus Tectomicrobia bacterium]|uniref:ABC transporter permease subunit n=1 Tax=Tectimicrobiota bacterium TaxID=2528274 RepID=A0A932M1N2_UNCTE|nr:ABC transporter permease subunit [Candidatus Tectomicrobia bacterium]
MKIIAIAVNTFREAVRDKILYSLLFFALVMMSLSVILGNLTIGEQIKIIEDFGLGTISLFGVLIAVFVGVGLVYKEIERRTIYTILSKPIPRWVFLLGKYGGLLLTLLVEVSVMAAFFVLLVLYYGVGFDFALLKAIGLIYLELALITAVALFFSAFTTPTLSGLFALGIFVIGHLSSDLKIFGQGAQDPFISGLTSFLYYLLPNLENFNIKGQVVHGIPVPWEFIGWSTLYGLLYITGTLLLTVLVFQRRDFR